MPLVLNIKAMYPAREKVRKENFSVLLENSKIALTELVEIAILRIFLFN